MVYNNDQYEIDLSNTNYGYDDHDNYTPVYMHKN